MRSRQGRRLRGIVRRSIVDDHHFARKLPGLQDNGSNRRALVEGGDGHEDIEIWKRLSQDRRDRRRRIFEHVSSYSSGRWPTVKPCFPPSPARRNPGYKGFGDIFKVG